MCFRLKMSHFAFMLLWISCSTIFEAIAEDDFRLPESVIPVHYQLTLLPLIEDEPRLCGHVWINVTAQSPTDLIVLHINNLLPSEVVVLEESVISYNNEKLHRDLESLCNSDSEEEDSNEIESRHDDDWVDALDIDDETEQLLIYLKEEMVVGVSYHIGITYRGEIYDTDNFGFFRVESKKRSSHRWIGATQLEATHARKVFPCLDEPALKATFDLTVGHSSALTAISNMPTRSSTPMATYEGWVWERFQVTPPMSTYLLAIVLSEMQHVETNYTSIDGRIVPIRLWTVESQINQIDLPYYLVPKAIRALENYLNIPYSLPKLDMVALPGYDKAGAMENWGLILHSERTFLTSSENNSTSQRALLATTLVHELAHQWFGNLVTSRWWDDIWLNEGFSTLFETIILKEVAPHFNLDFYTALLYQQALYHDKAADTNPLNYPVEKLPTIEHKFDGFIYAKASSIFRMFQTFLGDEAFRPALRRYFQQHQFKAANSTDFWSLLTQEARRTYMISTRMNVATIMRTWTDQPGYPLVTVEHTPNGTLQLTQAVFVDPKYPLPNDTSPIYWWVPITLTNGGSPQFSRSESLPDLWLTPKKPTVTLQDPELKDNWVLLNINVSSYYRVNYDETGWYLLTQQLMKDHTAIPPLNRAQLIDDVFSLAHAKMLGYEVALKLIEYLGNTNEEDYIRSVAVGHISRIQEALTLNNDMDNYDNKLGSMVEIMMSYVIRSPNSARLNQDEIKELILDCNAEDTICKSNVLRFVRNFVTGFFTSSQAKFMRKNFDTVWCKAVLYGDDTEWSYLWNRTSLLSVPTSEKTKLLKAMGCTQDAGQMDQLLTRIFQQQLEQQPIETWTILTSLAENPAARQLALDFVMRNWAYLYKHYQNLSRLRGLLVAITQRVLTTEQQKKVETFLAKNEKDLGKGIVDHIVTTFSQNRRQNAASRSYA